MAPVEEALDCVLLEAAWLLAAFAGVGDGVAFFAVPCVVDPVACAFAVPGAAVAAVCVLVVVVAADGFADPAPALAGEAAGVGDGLLPAGCWPLELVLCAVAMAARHVASPRIRISFISLPFACCLTTTPYFFTAAG